jgi:hypothetical protein
MSNCTYSALVVDVYAGILQQLSHSARFAKSGSIVESLIVVTLQRWVFRYGIVNMYTHHIQRGLTILCVKLLMTKAVGYTH